jgi:hypothetical protein
VPWLDPSLTLRWGPYIKLDAQDELQTVQMVAAAKLAGGITKRQMVEKFAPIFGTKDVDSVLEALEQESQDEIEAAQKAMQVTGGTKPTEPGQSGGAQRPPAAAAGGKAGAPGGSGRASSGQKPSG